MRCDAHYADCEAQRPAWSAQNMHPVDSIVRAIVTPPAAKNKGLFRCSGVPVGEIGAEALSVINNDCYKDALRAVLNYG